MRVPALALLSLLLLPAGPATAVRPPAPAVLTDLDRPDLIFPYFRETGSPGGGNVQVKGLKSPAAVPRYALAAGEGYPGSTFTCLNFIDCFLGSGTPFPQRPAGYGRIFLRNYFTASTEHFLAAAIYMPDSVKRTTNAAKTKGSVSIKQKAYVLLVRGRLDSFVGPSTYNYFVSTALPSCKGQAKTSLDALKGISQSKLKVSCKDSEIDASAAAWRTVFERMGLNKAVFNFRGKELF